MKITNDSCCAQEITSSGGSGGDTVLNITGNPTISSNTITTIDVTGDSNISSNIITSLVVTGTTYITGSVEQQPVLSIIGDVYVSNALTTNDAYVTNKLMAAGAEITGTLIAGGSVQTTDAVVSGLLVSENIRVSNLSVTGNFYVTATNTTTTNSFTIDNTGTTTALIVRQTEPTVHTHNVAEFYDATTPALIIDPEGNLAVHTTVSPNYAMTLVDGASFDVLTIRGNPPRTSLGVTGNVYASNAVTTTNAYVSNKLTATDIDVTNKVMANNADIVYITANDMDVYQTLNATNIGVTNDINVTNKITAGSADIYYISAYNLQLISTTDSVPPGTLQFDETAGIYNATIGDLRGITPTQYMYQINTGTGYTSLTSGLPFSIIPPVSTGITLAVGKYFIKADWYTGLQTPAGTTSNIQSTYTGTATFVSNLSTSATRNGALIITRILSKDTYVDISGTLLANTQYPNILVSFTGSISVTSPGTFLIISRVISANGSVIPGINVNSGTYIMIQPLGATGANINIGGWS